jgi:hypothetical protein
LPKQPLSKMLLAAVAPAVSKNLRRENDFDKDFVK